MAAEESKNNISQLAQRALDSSSLAPRERELLELMRDGHSRQRPLKKCTSKLRPLAFIGFGSRKKLPLYLAVNPLE
jgi:hypothetical protein